MKRKVFIVSLLIISLICIFTFTSNASEAGFLPFKDIPENAWYRESAEFCYANEIIKGQGDESTFAPNVSLTRATFTVMLARGLDADISAYVGESSFSDCPVGAWYTESVEWAYDKGYVKGTSEAEFSPDNTITREEAAAILARVLALKAENDSLSAYTDKEVVSIWARESVNSVIGAKLMGSTSTQKFVFSPKMTMTRAQASKILMSILKDHIYGDCEHNVTAKLCSEVKKCEKCGLILSLPSEHSYSSTICTERSVCEDCGYVREATEHYPIFSDCAAQNFCRICHEYLPPKAHNTQNGICTVCNKGVFDSDYDSIVHYVSSSEHPTIIYEYPNGDTASLEISHFSGKYGSAENISAKYIYFWSDGSDCEIYFSFNNDRDSFIYEINYTDTRGEESSACGDIKKQSMQYSFTSYAGKYVSWLEREVGGMIANSLTLIDIELYEMCGIGLSGMGISYF